MKKGERGPPGLTEAAPILGPFTESLFVPYKSYLALFFFTNLKFPRNRKVQVDFLNKNS